MILGRWGCDGMTQGRTVSQGRERGCQKDKGRKCGPCHVSLQLTAAYQGARPMPIMRRYHSWKCCMPSSIGLW